MKNKIIFSLLLILLVLFGVSLGFGQTWTTYRPDTAIKIWVGAANPQNAVLDSATRGFDSTSYVNSRMGGSGTPFRVTSNTATDTVRTLFQASYSVTTGSHAMANGYIGVAPRKTASVNYTGDVKGFKLRDTLRFFFSSKYYKGLPTGTAATDRAVDTYPAKFAFVSTNSTDTLRITARMPGWAGSTEGAYRDTVPKVWVVTDRQLAVHTSGGRAGTAFMDSTSDRRALKVYDYNKDTLMIVFNTTQDSMALLISNLKVRVNRLNHTIATYTSASNSSVGRLFLRDTLTPLYNGILDTLLASYTDSTSGGTRSLTIKRGSNYMTSTSGTTLAGAGGDSIPVLKLQLLPGKIAFVRWNVGIYRDNNGTGSAANPKSTYFSAGVTMDWSQPRTIGTVRRNHNRGYAAGLRDYWRPFRAGEALSNNGLGSNSPDTLYLFDADSNLVDDSSTVANILPVDSLTPSTSLIFNTTTADQRMGLRIFKNYNLQGLGVGSVSGTRIRQVRVKGYIPSLAVEEDTLNSQKAPKDYGFYSHYGNASAGVAGYIDTTINIMPNFPFPDSTTLTYRYGVSAESTPTAWPKTDLSSDQVKDSIAITVSMKDQYGNIINNGLVGLTATSSTITNLQWNSPAPKYGAYLNADLAGNTYGITWNANVDTLFMKIRNNNVGTYDWSGYNARLKTGDLDDGGKVSGLLINPCSTYPTDQITFNIFTEWANDATGLATYFPDTGSTSASSAIGHGFKVNPLTYTGKPTYSLTINPGTADTLRLWSAELYRDSSYSYLTPISFGGTTALVDSVVTTDDNTATAKVVKLFAKVKDRCGKNIIPSAATEVTFEQGYFSNKYTGALGATQGGKNFADVADRKLRGGTDPSYGSLGTAYIGAGVSVKRGPQSTYSSDVIGKDAVNRVWADFTVPTIKADTVVIRAKVTSRPSVMDTFNLVTFSGPPANLRYYTATGARTAADSLPAASNSGANAVTVTYKVYDAFYDQVDPLNQLDNLGTNYSSQLPAYTTNTGVVWRLNGPTRFSGSIYDASWFPNPWTTAQRGRRQILRTLKTGNTAFTTGATLTYYPDTVAGKTSTVVNNLVFPIERSLGTKADVFMSGTYDAATDVVNKTYAWTIDNTSIFYDSTWYLPLTYNSSMTQTTDVAYGGTSISSTQGRGYNQLQGWVVWNGNKAIGKHQYVTGQEYLVFETVPDTATMNISWLQGPFYTNTGSTATIPYLSNDSTTVQTKVANRGNYTWLKNNFAGRHGAINMGIYGSKKIIIDSLAGYSTSDSIKNYPGQIDTFYVRQYDKYYNPYCQSSTPGNSTLGYQTGGDTVKVVFVKAKNARYALPKLNEGLPSATPDSCNQVWWASGRGISPRADSVANSPAAYSPSTSTGKVDKVLITSATSQLRGAYRLVYQTLFAKSDSTLNQGDTALFIAYNMDGATVLATDSGVIRSAWLALNASAYSSTLESKFSSQDTVKPIIGRPYLVSTTLTYPEMLRQGTLYAFNSLVPARTGQKPANYMLMYDENYTSFNPKNPHSPLLDILPKAPWVTNPLDTNYYDNVGKYIISATRPVTLADTIKFNGKTTAGNNVESKFMGGAYYDANGNLVFKSYRAGKFKFKLVDQSALAFSSKGSAKTVNALPTKYIPAWFVVQPGSAHVVTMTNPANAFDAAKPLTDANNVKALAEPVSYTLSGTTVSNIVPAPVRHDYFDQSKDPNVTGDRKYGMWDPTTNLGILAGANPTTNGLITDTIGSFNGAIANYYINPPLNARCYTQWNNIDTVFFNEAGVYSTPLKYYYRVFDRWGNRRFDAPLYVTVDITDGQWAKANMSYPTSQGGEFRVWNDTTKLTTLRKAGGALDTNNIVDSLVSFVERVSTAQDRSLNGYGKFTMYFSGTSTSNTPHAGTTDLSAGTKTIIAYREIFVKSLKYPGKPTLTISPSIATLHPNKLIRIDGNSSPDSQIVFTPYWTTGKFKEFANWRDSNLIDDGVTYKVLFSRKLDDGTFESEANAYSVNINDWRDTAFSATAKGMSTFSTTVYGLPNDSARLVAAVGLTDAKPNRDVNVTIIAINKWGLRTASDPVLVTFEKNVCPPAFVLSQPPVKASTPDTVFTVTSSNTLQVGWNTPADANGVNGLSAVNDVTQAYFGTTTYKLDSMFYKVSLTKLNNSFPNNIAPATFDTVVTLGNKFTFDNNLLWRLLGATSATQSAADDSVTYNWTVTAVDRRVGSGIAWTYDWTNPTWSKVSDMGDILLTKIDLQYKIVITRDSLTGLAVDGNSKLKLVATDSQAVVLEARDGSDDVIRGFYNVTDGTTSPSIKLRIAGLKAGNNTLQARTISYLTYKADATTDKWNTNYCIRCSRRCYTLITCYRIYTKSWRCYYPIPG